MSANRPSLGAEAPGIYYAPPDEGHYSIDPRHAGQTVLSQELKELSAPDSDKVGKSFDEAMLNLYGEDRDFAGHNDQMLRLYREYFGDDKLGHDDPTVQVRKMTVALHDPVEHLIREPEETARKRDLDPYQAVEIKAEAIHRMRVLLGLEKGEPSQPEAVKDRDGLIKAYLFAIDSSFLETVARGWRGEATQEADELPKDEFNDQDREIVKAVINKTELLETIDQKQLMSVMKRASPHLIDLKLRLLDESTLKHNVEGLVTKSIESFENILNPPENNFASTCRDCIEALSFFVPALTMYGYQRLATELRGAALEKLFDDPNGDAARQRELSERYKARVDNIVLTRLTEQFSGMEAEALGGIKTNGSIRKKLAEKDYQNMHMVPDGIRYAFIVPDDMAWEEMKQHARAFQASLTGEGERIVAAHPHPDKKSFEEVNKGSGYKAIHLTFLYYPEDCMGEPVPFEIQVMTHTQHEMKQYHGRWSNVLYQAGKQELTEEEFVRVAKPYLERMRRRAQAVRELPPGTSVESIAEALALTGEEVPFVFTHLFKTVRIGDSRLMVPHELAGLAEGLGSRLANVADEARDAIIIPPTKVTESQFKEALGLLGAGSVDKEGQFSDLNIANALKLVKEAEGDSKRDDDKTLVLEGHLLPVALAALMLAIQSGKIWDHENLGPKEFASNLVTITLLHDYVEKHLDEVAKVDRALVPEKRQELLYEVKRMFGTEIMEGVDAMTVPLEIEDPLERHEAYRQNIKANEWAQIIKPVDRDQNHVTDLVKLLVLSRKRLWDETDQKVYWKKAREYPAKTDRHQSKEFTAPYMPRAYRQMHQVVWEFLKHFGYEPEQSARAQSGDI